jgi:hypothetical protein
MRKYKLREVSWAGAIPTPIEGVAPIQFEARDGAEARRALALLAHVSGRHFQLVAELPPEAE